MSNSKRDCLFYINWENLEKDKMIKYPIGLLARIDDYYYLKCYSNAKVTPPGFKKDIVYKSSEKGKIFNYFERRIFKKEAEDLCEELLETKGRTMTDSFFVEEIKDEKLKKECRSLLLNMHRNQMEIIQIQEKNNISK